MKNLNLLLGLFSLAGMAAAHSYKCKYVEGDDVGGTFRDIQVTSKTLRVASEDYVWSGKFDRRYKPRPGNKNYVRFEGKYEEGPGFAAEYTPWYLVEKNLLNGYKKGYLKEQARGEGYFATKFFCWLSE